MSCVPLRWTAVRGAAGELLVVAVLRIERMKNGAAARQPEVIPGVTPRVRNGER
jgi:hypothetical protein